MSSRPTHCSPKTGNHTDCAGTGFTGNDVESWPRSRRIFIPEVNFLTVPISGYLATVLVLFTIVTNFLVCLVLLRRNMRSPTNLLLVAMAVSTSMTGVCPTPCYIYFFVLGYHRDYVPCSWCLAYDVLTDFLPTVFHTASIWLTVALACQRYITVCHAVTAKRWCTGYNVVRVTMVIHLAALLSQVSRFFESSYSPIEIPSKLDSTRNVTGCQTELVPFVARNENTYFNTYYCFRVVFIHIVPCVVLVLLNALLVHALQTAHARRRLLLRQNRKSECRRLAESNSTTLMLVAVVGVFLIVEFPLAIFFVLLILDNTFDITLTDSYSNSVASLLINYCILFTYPMNFFIYCGMSRQFRETFRSLCRTGGEGGGSGRGSGGPVSRGFPEISSRRIVNGLRTETTEL